MERDFKITKKRQTGGKKEEERGKRGREERGKKGRENEVERDFKITTSGRIYYLTETCSASPALRQGASFEVYGEFNEKYYGKVG